MHAQLGYGVPQWLFSLPGYRAAEKRARERARELLSWVGLDAQGRATSPTTCRYGDQRKLELARALATEPRLLLLDEPVAGMNSGEKAELMTEIGRIAGARLHGVHDRARHALRDGPVQRIAVLNFGRIIAEGPPETIRNDPAVIEAYLGRDGMSAHALLEVSGLAGRLRPHRGRAGHRLSRRAGRDPHAGRRQRRRQVDDAAGACRAWCRRAPARSASTATTSRAWRRTRSSSAGWCRSPKAAPSSPR